MPNCVMNSIELSMTLHHVLLKFYLNLPRSLHGLLKLIQRHITLHTKGTSCLLKETCFEHHHVLIHRLQQRRGVRRQGDKLDVTMQVLQHVGLEWSIIEDHQDIEGEALRCAIVLQLIHQPYLGVFLKNVIRHPTSGIGEPVGRQAAIIVFLECTRVLGKVDHDRLELAISLSG